MRRRTGTTAQLRMAPFVAVCEKHPSQGGDTGSNPVGTTRKRAGQGPCPVRKAELLSALTEGEPLPHLSYRTAHPIEATLDSVEPRFEDPSNPRKRPAHRGHEQEVATAKTGMATWRLGPSAGGEAPRPRRRLSDLWKSWRAVGRDGAAAGTSQRRARTEPPRAGGLCYEPAGRGNNLRVAVPFREAGSGAAK
jgi:hypothetical protein